MGDVISALPALRDLRAGYPDARITLVANEYVRGALEGCPYVDEVVYGFAYRHRSWPAAAVMRLGLAARIAGRFDVFLALRSSPRSSAVLGLLSGAPTRVGYHQVGLAGRMLTHDLGRQPALQSNRLTNLAVVKALGLKAGPELPALDWVKRRDRDLADALLALRGVEIDQPFAVLQVASHWGCYEWRSDKWAEVVEHVSVHHGLKVVVVGTAEDFELRKFAEVAELTRRATSIQGLTTLPMLFHIVSRAAVVIAPDSALTQVAMAQRVPAAILFGIEPRVRNGPVPGETDSLVQSLQHWEGREQAPPPNPHCRFGESHCHTANCRENSSFRQIDAPEVCRRIDILLGAPRSAVAGV